MILKRAMIEAFLRMDAQSAGGSVGLPSALLFHGPNEGLGYFYAKRLVSHLVSESMGLVRLRSEALVSNRGLLGETLSSPSLFGGRIVVWISIREGERIDIASLTSALEVLSDRITERSSVVIVTAAILRKDSAVRRAFEKYGGALACYEEDPIEYIPMVEEIFARGSLRSTPQLLEALVRALPQDRQAAQREAEKIVLFYGEGAELDDSVFPILCEWEEVQMFDILYRAFDGDVGACVEGLSSYPSSSAIPLIRSTGRHIRQLLYLQGSYGKERGDLVRGIATLRPFVLFGLRGRLLRQAMVWRSDFLGKLLLDSLAVEGRVKVCSLLSGILAERFLLRVAQHGRKLGVTN